MLGPLQGGTAGLLSQKEAAHTFLADAFSSGDHLKGDMLGIDALGRNVTGYSKEMKITIRWTSILSWTITVSGDKG